MNAAEITDKLGLHNLRQRKWHTQVQFKKNQAMYRKSFYDLKS